MYSILKLSQLRTIERPSILITHRFSRTASSQVFDFPKATGQVVSVDIALFCFD
jgi:hypothetical protein